MAKKKLFSSGKGLIRDDFAKWNFVIFLTLALILLVFVSINMNKVSLDIRSKAGLSCPQISDLPRPEACPGGKWTFQRDANGCRAFFCDPTSPTPTTTPAQ